MTTSSGRRPGFDTGRHCIASRGGVGWLAMSAKQPTVLVVDDDPEIVTMVAMRLGKCGYRIITAMDGNDALEAARRERPALIVLDVMMPGKTGWEVARALRQDPVTDQIKIVMLTAIGE